jgi:hypothetical protein
MHPSESINHGMQGATALGRSLIYKGGLAALPAAFCMSLTIARALWHALRANFVYSSAMARRGKILAIKWGMNPNSSSLGVDVTFLIAGATLIALATPVLGALLRVRAMRTTRRHVASDQTAGNESSDR